MLLLFKTTHSKGNLKLQDTECVLEIKKNKVGGNGAFFFFFLSALFSFGLFFHQPFFPSALFSVGHLFLGLFFPNTVYPKYVFSSDFVEMAYYESMPRANG